MRAARRMCGMLLLALLVAGCGSIGFSIRGDVGRFVGGTVGSSLRWTSDTWHRVNAHWYTRGVLVGVKPGQYVATSISQSMEKGEAPEEFSPEQQYYVGRGVSAALVDEFGMEELDPPAVQAQLSYLNRMAGFLQVTAGDGTGLWAGVRVGILDSRTVAAFATPGGFIWVTRGALQLVRSEEELAALLCHELGHVAHEHAIKAYVKDGGGQVRANPWLANLDLLNPVRFHTGNYFGGLAKRIAENRYTVDQEYEADQWAAVALQQAGYSHRALIRLLERIEEWEINTPDAGAYLANHPPVSDRLKRLEDFFRREADHFRPEVDAEAAQRQNERFRAVLQP
jgi:beta-barrel assembly-enhancing protease